MRKEVAASPSLADEGPIPAQEHEPLRLPDGERPQERLVHEREDGGIRADAQPDRHESDHRERRIPAQHSQRVAQILADAIHEGQSAGVAALFLALLDTTEVPQSGVASFLRRHARGNVLLDLALQVVTHFLVQLVLDARGPQEGTKSEAKHVDPAHVLLPCSGGSHHERDRRR